MKVEIINMTFCKAVDVDARGKLSKLLRYRHTWFTRGKYSKVRQTRLLSFMDERSGFFLSGFLPRVKRKYPALQISKSTPFMDVLPPELDRPIVKGITFRGDQLRAVRAATDKGRGVIKFATASGKTVIAAGIISCFNEQTVFLAHRQEIVVQTFARFKEYGFEVGVLTGAKKKDVEAKVLCATIQSYFKAWSAGEVPLPQVVIIDECHHVSRLESQYDKLLSAVTAPIKIGLTGTKPNDRYGRLCMEGLIGPVIATLTMREGIDKGILSKPKITLIPVPKLGTVSRLKTYYEIYDQGVAFNVMRNKLIMDEVKLRVAAGKSCLIIVDKIKHGEKLLENGSGIAKFLQGKTASKLRAQVKQELIEKKTACVITTNIWGEGVDIPTLDVVVLAFCGKANTKTIQTIGRGLRSTADKKQVEIIDFLDPYKFLGEHLVQRLTIYIKEGLM